MYKLYLMRRLWNQNHCVGNNSIIEQCRIGITSQSPNKRFVQESANAGWILKNLDIANRSDAHAYEVYMAYNLGIPQTLWKERGLSGQEWLDSVWWYVKNNWNRGQAALKAFGKDENTPDWKHEIQEWRYDRERRIIRARLNRCPDKIKCLYECNNPKHCLGTADRLVTL